jgi:antitoxin ChpS
VGLAVDGERLVIDPNVKPHSLLDKLLAHCDVNASLSDEDRAWVDIAPIGREL